MRKPVCITLATHKGGVGKTMITINLSHVLAKFGYRVLVVDLDPQKNTTDVLLGKNGDENYAGTVEMFTNNNDVITNLYHDTRYENLKIIPSSMELANIELQYAGTPDGLFGFKAKFDSEAQDFFDFVFFDCNPSINGFISTALFSSNYYIVPIEAESRFALDGMKLLNRTIESMRKGNADLKFLKAVLNKYDTRTRTSRGGKAIVEQHFKGKVFKTSIRMNTDISRAFFRYQTIFEYSKGKKHIPFGIEDFESLGNEIIETLESMGVLNAKE